MFTKFSSNQQALPWGTKSRFWSKKKFRVKIWKNRISNSNVQIQIFEIKFRVYTHIFLTNIASRSTRNFCVKCFFNRFGHRPDRRRIGVKWRENKIISKNDKIMTKSMDFCVQFVKNHSKSMISSPDTSLNLIILNSYLADVDASNQFLWWIIKEGTI